MVTGLRFKAVGIFFPRLEIYVLNLIEDRLEDCRLIFNGTLGFVLNNHETNHGMGLGLMTIVASSLEDA